MHLALATCLSVISFTSVLAQSSHYTKSPSEGRHVQYKKTISYEQRSFDDDEDDVEAAASQIRRPIYGDENYPVQNAIPIPVRPQPRPPHPHTIPLGAIALPRRPSGPPQQFRQQIEQSSPLPLLPQIRLQSRQQPYGIPIHRRPPNAQVQEDEQEKSEQEKEEEEEKDEPDRLSLLLPQSKFDCVSKNTGYYADEILNCEVFHYCQENVKHSWICPDGFTFHQVHLICMPPGADNICDKSSQYHFVNEYLYKPVNLEEHQNKPNVSLRYSERFYPDQQYRNDDYQEDDEAPIPQRKQPIRIQQAAQHAPQAQVARRPLNQPLSLPPTYRPEASGQVYRTSEEINIPLNYRRPQYIPQRFSPRGEADYK